MDWISIGGRIRRQREFLDYTREQFVELLDVTPKFCSDIELGVKGMSVQTLCQISEVLRLPTDFILFGRENAEGSSPITQLLSLQAGLCGAASETLHHGNERRKRITLTSDSFLHPLPAGNGSDLAATKQLLVCRQSSGRPANQSQAYPKREAPKLWRCLPAAGQIFELLKLWKSYALEHSF